MVRNPLRSPHPEISFEPGAPHRQMLPRLTATAFSPQADRTSILPFTAH
jgi:hypothetical protein